MNLSKDISILYRKMKIELDFRLQSMGISHSQHAIIHCLKDHSQLTQSDICHLLDLDKSTVTKALLKMEKQDLIHRHTNPDDIRSFLVTLTPKSLQIAQNASAIIDEWGQALTSSMTTREKEDFYRLLEIACEQAKALSNH